MPTNAPITKQEAIDELRDMLAERQRRFPNAIRAGKISRPVAEKKIRALQKAIELLDPSIKPHKNFGQKSLRL